MKEIINAVLAQADVNRLRAGVLVRLAAELQGVEYSEECDLLKIATVEEVKAKHFGDLPADDKRALMLVSEQVINGLRYDSYQKGLIAGMYPTVQDATDAVNVLKDRHPKLASLLVLEIEQYKEYFKNRG